MMETTREAAPSIMDAAVATYVSLVPARPPETAVVSPGGISERQATDAVLASIDRAHMWDPAGGWELEAWESASIFDVVT
jgi:hypothetical protein